MDWFFSDASDIGEMHLITGEDAVHITKSLRMSVGESITLCDSSRTEHLCRIERITPEGVLVRAVSRQECTHEPDVRVSLYMSLTKGDKPETVIQKAVELGVYRIVPVLTDRCVSRPDPGSAGKKLQRYRKIALQAAMQSQRAVIPEVKPMITLREAAEELDDYDVSIVFYEGGGLPLRLILDRPEYKNIALFIGPEGGFEEREIELLREKGTAVATLGQRILRAETAPLAAIAAIMFHTGNLE